MVLLEEKEIEIKYPGEERTKTFYLSKFTATVGREIIAKYPTSAFTSALPKVGDYKTNEEVMLQLMSYVHAKTSDGGRIRLTTKALVDNHVPNWEMLVKLEGEMINYNCSFFQNGRLLDFLGNIVQRLPSKVTATLTDLLAPSSEAEKPRSEN